MKRAIRKLLRRLGYDVIRYQPSSHAIAKRAHELKVRGIDVVLDVGANTGQYAEGLRDLGYAGRIVSFEPLREAMGVLNGKTRSDSNWQACNYALGDTDMKSTIHVSRNSWSSSILDVLPSHVDSVPASEAVGAEPIEVRRLDSVFDQFCQGDNHVFLKIDTQGYEKQVLEGAKESLCRIEMLAMEVSFVPLYEGQLLFCEMYDRVCGLGYQLASIEQGWWDSKTGVYMQADAVFTRQ